MICPNCSEELAQGAVFCPLCGTKIAERTAEVHPIELSVKDPVVTKPRNRKVKTVIIISAIIVFLTGSVFAWLIISSRAMVSGTWEKGDTAIELSFSGKANYTFNGEKLHRVEGTWKMSPLIYRKSNNNSVKANSVLLHLEMNGEDYTIEYLFMILKKEKVLVPTNKEGGLDTDAFSNAYRKK